MPDQLREPVGIREKTCVPPRAATKPPDLTHLPALGAKINASRKATSGRSGCRLIGSTTATLFHHLSSRYQVSLGEVPPFEQKGFSFRLRKGIRKAVPII